MERVVASETFSRVWRRRDDKGPQSCSYCTIESAKGVVVFYESHSGDALSTAGALKVLLSIFDGDNDCAFLESMVSGDGNLAGYRDDLYNNLQDDA